jgi:hypothetical protein
MAQGCREIVKDGVTSRELQAARQIITRTGCQSRAETRKNFPSRYVEALGAATELKLKRHRIETCVNERKPVLHSLAFQQSQRM